MIRRIRKKGIKVGKSSSKVVGLVWKSIG